MLEWHRIKPVELVGSNGEDGRQRERHDVASKRALARIMAP